MKKAIIFSFILGFFIVTSVLAVNSTLTGTVSAIHPDSTNPKIGSFEIVKNLNWFNKITGALFNKPKQAPITVNVNENTKFLIRTATTTGYTDGDFSDLKVNDKVVVTVENPSTDTTNYSATEVKITGRFIPPHPTPSIKPPKEGPCSWCGNDCVVKTKEMNCPDVEPPTGYVCKLIDNKCQKITASDFTRDKITKEMDRIKKQIQVLEQRLKDLEKLLTTASTTSSTTSQ